MRYFLPAFFILLLAVAPGIAADHDAAADDSGVTVLIYHRFGEEKYPTTNITVHRFREQLEYLKKNDYTVIPLQQLIQHLHHGKRLPGRSVVITIDDGYRSVYENAWPVLSEYGFPFTVFLYTKATEEKHWNYMNWEQVLEMKTAGVDFQNHGFAHEHMAFKPPGMDMNEYRTWIRKDLAVSIRILADKLHEQPRFFAVPYGEYNEILLEEIRSFGFEAILLQDPGSVSRDTDPFAIPREPILGTDWSTMDHFQMVLERVDMPITGEIPAAGWLPDSIPELFGAKLLYPERYVPGTLGIYVSELGWHKTSQEGDFAGFTNSITLTRRINRVAISAREKESGRTAIHYWMVVMKTGE